jgi:hypothetical protein
LSQVYAPFHPPFPSLLPLSALLSLPPLPLPSAFPGLPSSKTTKRAGLQSLGQLKKEMFGIDSSASSTSGGNGEGGSSWLEEEYRLQRAQQAKEEAAGGGGGGEGAGAAGGGGWPGYHWSDAHGAWVHDQTGELFYDNAGRGGAGGAGAGEGKKKKGA